MLLAPHAAEARASRPVRACLKARVLGRRKERRAAGGGVAAHQDEPTSKLRRNRRADERCLERLIRGQIDRVCEARGQRLIRAPTRGEERAVVVGESHTLRLNVGSDPSCREEPEGGGVDCEVCLRCGVHPSTPRSADRADDVDDEVELVRGAGEADATVARGETCGVWLDELGSAHAAPARRCEDGRPCQRGRHGRRGRDGIGSARGGWRGAGGLAEGQTHFSILREESDIGDASISQHQTSIGIHVTACTLHRHACRGHIEALVAPRAAGIGRGEAAHIQSHQPGGQLTRGEQLIVGTAAAEDAYRFGCTITHERRKRPAAGNPLRGGSELAARDRAVPVGVIRGLHDRREPIEKIAIDLGSTCASCRVGGERSIWKVRCQADPPGRLGDTDRARGGGACGHVMQPHRAAAAHADAY